jgi:hypothetical protein
METKKLSNPMYPNGLLLKALKLNKVVKNVYFRRNWQLPGVNVLQRRSEAFKLLKLFILKTIKN